MILIPFCSYRLLNMFFWEISIKIICDCSLGCLSFCERVLSNLLFSEYKTLNRYIIYKYYLLYYVLFLFSATWHSKRDYGFETVQCIHFLSITHIYSFSSYTYHYDPLWVHFLLSDKNISNFFCIRNTCISTYANEN